MDTFGLPKDFTDVKIYVGGSTTAGQNWQVWHKPMGCRFVDILLFGQGGGGGSGVVGANSTAAGGGGGGSGGQTRVFIPAHLLPDVLYISCGEGASGAGVISYVSIRPNTTANHIVAVANGGGVGGNASGATAGTAGTAASVAGGGTMPIGFNFASVLAGQAGTAGGTTGAAPALTIPATGLLVTGGTGGAGLGAAGVAGTAGGSFTIPAAPSPFPAQPGGTGGSTTTTPPNNGNAGIEKVIQGLQYNYGATGGGSTHGSATGAGLIRASGGNGAPGCGGGGMGGALTGSTGGTVSKGGPGFCIITAF